MARVLNVVCVLSLCVALAQPSYAFPLYGGCDSYNDCSDDCAESGYLRYPDEPVLPLQVFQGGPTCYRCKPLPYQIQVPLPPPTAPCGQQFGVRVEVPHQSVACKPCLNIGYEVETPITPCVPKLPNLPVSFTVPVPQLPCHQPCHVNYEVETPVAPCAPLLTNLKTQVDRVVLPCPCPAPIVEGYVPKSDPLERCKRSVECEDSGCDCDCDDDDREDEDDCVDDRTYSRSRRSPSNWRPCSYTRRIELFPNSRTDQSPRSDWTADNLDELDDFEEEYQDDLYDEPVTESPRFTGTHNGNDGNPRNGNEERIVSRDLENPNDQDRIVNRGLGNQNDQERILDRGLGNQDQERIVSRSLGNRDGEDRVISLSQDYDYPQWNTALSSDPVEKRLQDSNFGNRRTLYGEDLDRILIDSLLSNSGNSGQLVPSDINGGGTAIDNLLGTVKTGPQQGGRIQSTRKSYPQQNRRPQANDTQPPPNGMRLNGSSGHNRKLTRQRGSQDRITTPNTFRIGGQEQGGLQEQNGSQNQQNAETQDGSQGQHSPQRQSASQGQAGVQQRQGGSQQKPGGFQQRTSASQGQTGAQQRQGGSQQKSGGSEQRTGGPQQLPRDSQQRTGGPQQLPRDSQQRTGGSEQLPRDSQQRTGGSQQLPRDSRQRTGGSQQLPRDSRQRTGGSQQLPRDSQQRTGGSQQIAGGSQQGTGGSQQGPNGLQRNGDTEIQNASQRQPISGGRHQKTGRPNQQHRSPFQSPNSNRGRRPGQCNICERRKSLENMPYNLVLSMPDETIRFSDYLDYPGDLRPPTRNIPSRRMLPPQQRSPQQSSPSPNPQISQTPPTTPGQTQNPQSIPQPPQPPSPADTSRIVTPTTYDEQPQYFDYNY